MAKTHRMVQAAQATEGKGLADVHIAVEGHSRVHASAGELVDDILQHAMWM